MKIGIMRLFAGSSRLAVGALSVAAFSCGYLRAETLPGDGTLPTTVSNDYWCTWSYRNPAPDAAAGTLEGVTVRGSTCSGVLLADIVKRGFSWNASMALARFTSFPPTGLQIVIR